MGRSWKRAALVAAGTLGLLRPTAWAAPPAETAAERRVLPGAGDGTAPSVEERLTVSRRLRGLAGCVAVVNRLAVPPMVRGGVRLLPVSADGALAVQADRHGGDVPVRQAPPNVDVLAAPAVP